MEILNQLEDLFLAAVPTVIIVFLFYFFLRWSFFNPIARVLDERHRRAEGARQEAETSRAAVVEKLRSYNDSLKKARSEMFVEQEGVRRRVLDERQGQVSAARTAAQKSLQEAKKAIAADMEVAKSELQQTNASLAGEIADAILAGLSSGPDASRPGGAR